MDINTILKQMTLKDKIALCSGANFWETKKFEKYGIPSMFVCDGPHGLRRQDLEGGMDMLGINKSRPATCFPSEVTTAGSWDPELLEEIGAAIAEEAHTYGVGVVLGPGCNIKRNPLCGRNFEYFSEDPHLSGKLAAGFIRGVESHGVGTSLKHFAANSQEKDRFNSDSIIDERTLREIYLAGFETAVKEARPTTVMCAYPKLNGVHCSDSKELLTDILRREWGFEGIVVTDWGAMNDRTEGFRAGCDLNMPGGSAYMEKEVLKAVKNGILPESAVDDCARRIIELVLRAQANKVTSTYDTEAHHAIARKAAEQGAVLLKNDDNILPLREGANIAVIGAMAENMRFQGAGSSHINPTKISQPLDHLPNVLYAAGCDDRGDTNDTLITDAVNIASGADIAVVFAGLPDSYESEGFDREDMRMPVGHLRMIEETAKANLNTIVILLCGCAVECPWADKVKAILYMGLPGQAGGEAIANLLYGRANPCGSLAESWPLHYNDVPSSDIFGKTKDALYQESIYIGYRYYDKANVPVRWSFGHSLSYTQFKCSKLSVEGRKVSLSVTNTGKMYGAHTVKLYITAPQDGLHRPIRELRCFKKVFLEPAESKIVSFELSDRDFAVWCDGWKIPDGAYTIEVEGMTEPIYIKGERLTVPEWQSGSWYESCVGKPKQSEWEAMLGRSYAPTLPKKGQFTMDNSVIEMKEHSFIMKIMYAVIKMVVSKSFGGKKSHDDPAFRMMMASSAGSPLRSIQISACIKGGIMQGLLDMANGHFFRGIGKMIKG